MRKLGDSNFITLPLSRLNEVLAEYPNAQIKVGKGCIAALESVLNVSFGLGEGEEPTVASVAVGAVATVKPVANRPQFEVED